MAKENSVDYQFVGKLAAIAMALIMAAIAPLLAGRFLGHGWGVAMAIGALIGIVYCGLRWRMTFPTRAMWVVLSATMVLLAWYEYAQWRL